MTYLVAALAAFVLSCAVTPLVRLMNIVDVPNERSSHATPTPRGGGIAILAGTFGAAAALSVFYDPVLRWIAAGVVIVAVVGLIDDIRGLGALPRFLAHCAAALLAIFPGRLALERLAWPWGGELSFALLAIPVALLFVVGLTNAYNFMDGINGIASMEAIVAGVALALLFLQQSDMAGAIIAIALAAACAGFLPWNFPKAKIFMGDVGSGAIGFLLGGLVLRYTADGGPVIAALLPLLPFILDTAVTFVRRALRREKIFSAHRSHFYQRLNIAGWSHPAVTLLWSGLAAAGAIVALLYVRMTASERTISVAAVLLVHAVIAFAITRAEISQSR